MSEQKIKVVWLCHFSNAETRAQLPISRSKILSFIKRVTGRGEINMSADFAAWIPEMIKQFRKFDDVELHVVSPQVGLKKNIVEFSTGNIHYHFYRFELPFGLTRICTNLYPSRKHYFVARRNVKKIIGQVGPDIVNLIGAENGYHANTVLDVTEIPVVVTLQTVYSNPERYKYAKVVPINWDIEQLIFKKETYFCSTNSKHSDLLLQYKPDAVLFRTAFPFDLPQLETPPRKTFDLVYFAMALSRNKGAYDAIRALGIVKKAYPQITLKMVGTATESVMKELDELVDELSLKENVEFVGSFPLMGDLFEFVAKARFALLPIKMDFIPTTMIQSMCLGLPVITYATSGTPMLNLGKECVLIAEMENIPELAAHIERLMSSNELAERLKNNAHEYIAKNYDSFSAMRHLVDIYKAIIEKERNGASISDDLLY